MDNQKLMKMITSGNAEDYEIARTLIVKEHRDYILKYGTRYPWATSKGINERWVRRAIFQEMLPDVEVSEDFIGMYFNLDNYPD